MEAESNPLKCEICPRRCGIERNKTSGFCGMRELPMAAKASLHPYEEPILSGSRGSGAIFFSGCNLKCCYCQNYSISRGEVGKIITVERLSEIYLDLQDKGAHNINLVNPTLFTDSIIESIKAVKQKITIPFVWNSSGYERVESLRKLEGLIEVFLPDLKYVSTRLSALYSGAGDYFKYASQALLEMYRQAGGVCLNQEGLIEKGLIIRHLVLPNSTHDSLKVLQWIRENIPEDAYISLMGQYTPTPNTQNIRGLARRLSKREYDLVVNRLHELDLKNGFIQGLDSAYSEYTPDFDLSGL